MLYCDDDSYITIPCGPFESDGCAQVFPDGGTWPEKGYCISTKGRNVSPLKDLITTREIKDHMETCFTKLDAQKKNTTIYLCDCGNNCNENLKGRLYPEKGKPTELPKNCPEVKVILD